MVIHASLPVGAEEAILWAMRVPDTDVVVITGVTTSSLGESGRATPQSPGMHVGTPVPARLSLTFCFP